MHLARVNGYTSARTRFRAALVHRACASGEASVAVVEYSDRSHRGGDVRRRRDCFAKNGEKCFHMSY